VSAPMITALTIDDEKKNRESLQKLLKEYCPGVEVLGEAGSVPEAIDAIKQYRPKLVFLDVEMPNATGFDLLRQLPEITFKVIFVTAHAHYALKAIKFSAVDYLLKPVDVDDLVEAVSKAEKEIHFNHQAHYDRLLNNLDPGSVRKLAIPVKNGIAFLAPEDIVRLEADGTYTHIFSNGEKYTATKNIKEYEYLLTEFNFFRSHNSHLINLDHVKQFNRIDGYFVEMDDGSVAEISRRKKDEFFELMSRQK
jgi:two-component system LytT family response regulator